MNPNYIHTITLYRNIDGAWSRTVLQNCFWKSSILVVQSGTQATQTNSYVVRIPSTNVEEGFQISLDDIVVLGDCTDEITGKKPNTATETLRKNKPNAFKVTAFSDNTGHRMDKHYRLGG